MVGAGELLTLLRTGTPLTRADIVSRSGLARATVTHRLEALLAAGYVVSTPSPAATGGRPAELLTLNAGLGVLLVADIGSSHTRVGASDLAGNLLADLDLDLDVDEGPAAVFGRVDAAHDEVLAGLGVSADRVLGIAIGVPGPVEHATGRLVSPPTMTGWDGVRVPEAFAHRRGVPVMVDKDANIMALGVHRALDPPAEDVLVLKVGMGIGAGVISKGAIMRGAQGAAGDLGHMPRAGGALCRCGQHGCAEATAGGWAIAARLRAAGHDRVRTSADVVALARSRDPETLVLLRDAGRRIGEVVADAIGVLNPALVVVGGDLAEAQEPLMAGIRECVYQRSHPLATRHLQITTSPLGRNAGLRGAADLAADAALAPARVSRLVTPFAHH